MAGFFKIEKSVRQSKGRIPSCEACGLYSGARTPKMGVGGRGKKNILLLAEAPGETEDRRGEQLLGEAGQVQEEALKRLGIDLHRDCYKLNGVNCRPRSERGGNRTPTDFEVDCCRRRVLDAIKEIRPSLIIALGGVAVQSLYGHRMAVGAFNQWRGWTIPDQALQTWVCPTYHPSYIMRLREGDRPGFRRSKNKPVEEILWMQDLKAALARLEEPLPDWSIRPENIRLLRRRDQLADYLEKTRGLPCAFDFETTGLKPQAAGHQIVCGSISHDGKTAIVTPMTPEFADLWKRFLSDSKTPKVGFSIKFETIWAAEILGVQVRGWEWDGQLGSHSLDNRRGINDLEFQARVSFGMEPWSEEVMPYLRATKKGGNSFNRALELWKVAPGKMALYNGTDSIVERRLYDHQRALFAKEPKLLEGYSLFHEGILTMADMELRGIPLVDGYCEKTKEHLSRILDRQIKNIWETEEGRAWH